MDPNTVFLARQPILTAAGDLHGFELSFRTSQSGRGGGVDDTEATSIVVANLLGEHGMDRLLGGLRGFLNAGAQFLAADVVEVLPARNIVLEIPEATPNIAGLAPRCAELAKQGFAIAIDDYCGGFETVEPLLQHARIVKVDLSLMPRARLAAVVAPLKKRGVQLIAEKIESRDELELARSAGFDLFQGYHFAKPEVIQGRRSTPDQAGMMRLLSLALNDADLPEIEQEFKRQPQLGLNLLRMASSAAMGLTQKISSIRQALVMLGRRQLRLWLQLLMFTGRSGAQPLSPLLQAAAMRGRFMELAARKQAPGATDFHDHAFMTGMLSLADTLLKMPRAEVVEELHVADDVKRALLGGEGALGRLLALAEGLESPERPDVPRLLAGVGGLDDADLIDLELDAFRWSNNLFEPAAA